jgi:tetratricopeptide (TPR) repeat protein
MRSLYDLLGVRADDDDQAIKNAFRKAAKAHHPDLNPDDPDAALRFRDIITASAILRDASLRAAYDQLLEFDRQQIKLSLDQQRVRSQQKRRQIWSRRLRTTAVVAVLCCGLIGGYGLGIVARITNPPDAGVIPAVETAPMAETIRDDEVAASTATAKGRENAPAAVKAEAKTAGIQLMVHADRAGTDISDDVLRTGVSLFIRGAAVPANRLEPALGSLPDAVPNDSTFYRRRGIVAYRLGDFPGAIVNLDEAIRHDPNDGQAFNIRGNAWDEIGAFDSALADYDEAIRIDPNNPTFFYDRAILWHRKGELDKALLDLDRAIRFTFSDPNIYCDRGLVWYEKGRRERAIADFNKAIKLDSSVAGACMRRGLILHRNSDFAVAFADLGKTIQVSADVFDVPRILKQEN